MKIWLILCTALSGALVALQIAALRTSVGTWEKHDDGTLSWEKITEFDVREEVYGPESAENEDRLPWNFIRRMRSGDHAVVRRTTSRLPLLRKLKVDVATVSREGRVTSIKRSGQLEFYASLCGIAALPLAILAVAFALLRLKSDRIPSIS